MSLPEQSEPQNGVEEMWSDATILWDRANSIWLESGNIDEFGQVADIAIARHDEIYGLGEDEKRDEVIAERVVSLYSKQGNYHAVEDRAQTYLEALGSGATVASFLKGKLSEARRELNKLRYM